MKLAAVAVPRAVWVLGFVSLFMDLSSEIVRVLLPLFLTTTLGVSADLGEDRREQGPEKP